MTIWAQVLKSNCRDIFSLKNRASERQNHDRWLKPSKKDTSTGLYRENQEISISLCGVFRLILFLLLTWKNHSRKRHWEQTSEKSLFPVAKKYTTNVLLLFTQQQILNFKYIPSSSFGQSSQGSPHPSPGILLQQHLAFEVLKALGTEHFPFSKLVKQKLWRVSRRGKSSYTDLEPFPKLDDDCLPWEK